MKMHNGRINTAFDNASSAESSDSDSESLGSLVNPTSISALIEDLDNQAKNGKTSSETKSSKSGQRNQHSDRLRNSSFPPNAENYDDLIRKEFIRPWPGEKFTENVVFSVPTDDLSGDLVRNSIYSSSKKPSKIEELESTHDSNSNSDIERTTGR